MRLTKLAIEDWIAIKRVSLVFENPLTIVAGANEAGKTSLLHAIRAVLCGEVARVNLKSEHKQIIREGAKRAAIRAEWDGKVRDAKIAGTSTIPDACYPAFLLDQERLPSLEASQMRQALFDILAAQTDAETIRKKLEDAEVAKETIEIVLPLLPAGFGVMAQHAREKATEGRAEWRAAAGETYGTEKAKDWKPEREDELDAAVLAESNTVEARAKSLDDAEVRLEDYLPTLNVVEGELARAGASFTCPECGAITQAVKPERVAELKAQLPELEKGAQILRNAVTSRRRDLESAQRAAVQVKAAKEKLKKSEEDAKVAHQKVETWARMAQLLGPDGIPAELLADGLKRLQERLRETAQRLQLGEVSLGADMVLRRDGRPYWLQSESSRWLSQAMLLEAMVHITGSGLLVLDRLDVLDLGRRQKVVAWLMQLAQEGAQVLVCATLKARPAIPGAVWLEGGEVSATAA